MFLIAVMYYIYEYKDEKDFFGEFKCKILLFPKKDIIECEKCFEDFNI